MHVLTFHLELEELDDEDGKHYLSVAVQPLLDETPLIKKSGGLVFDAVRLLVAGTTQQELDIFTCSCGVAGCAGIFDEALLAVTETSVSWHFPEDPFRELVTAELIQADKPLVFVFDRHAYVRALEKLKADLIALDDSTPLTLGVAPGLWHDSTTTFAEKLDHTIKEQGRYRERKAQEEAKLKRQYGPLYNQAVEVKTAGGCIYRAKVVALGFALAQSMTASRQAEAPEEADVAANEMLEEHVLPLFLAGKASLLSAVQRIPMEDLHLYLWRHEGPNGCPCPDELSREDVVEWSLVQEDE